MFYQKTIKELKESIKMLGKINEDFSLRIFKLEHPFKYNVGDIISQGKFKGCKIIKREFCTKQYIFTEYAHKYSIILKNKLITFEDLLK